MALEPERWLSALLTSGDIGHFIDHPEAQAYLGVNDAHAAMYQIVEEHVTKYGKLPSHDTFADSWGSKLPPAPEPAKFYLDQLRPKYVTKTLHKASIEANEFLSVKPEKALEIMEAAVIALRQQQSGARVIDFRHAKDFVQANLKKKLLVEGVQLGWPGFDKRSGGLRPGDFWSIVGRSGLGKTMLMITRALNSWKISKKPTIFFSQEMTLEAILERAAAYEAAIPMDYMKSGMLPNLFHNFAQQLSDRLEAAGKAEVPLWFVDTNMAGSLADAKRLIQLYGAELAFMDGAYLFAGGDFRMRWASIAELATGIKTDVVMGMGVPVVASWQFGKAQKDKKGVAVQQDAQDVAGSKEIENLSSVMLGLFEDDTPESIMRRKVTVLKGRNGERGTFYTHWDWAKMNFDEWNEDEQPSELDVI